jgi:hypothetical protein
MSIARTYTTGVLAALVTASLANAPLHAQLPPIGSPNVAIADPQIPPPPSEPCIVPLFDEFTFIGFDAQLFDFTPPDACPGPWQKVVLSADFDVTAGRQFDRTAEIWLGGANIYFGTTSEPSATVARSWHVERDVTDYSALFAEAQAGRVDLGNLVDDTYTGILHGSASLAFYPLVDTVFDHPPRPDMVVPMAADATGGTVDLASSDDHLAIDFTPPQNVRRAFLDVIVEAQNTDEFWYLCVPDDLAAELESCPGTGFRETQVTIDGLAVGIASIYPWIYTGGIDPYLWRPSPGIQTLSFEPYRVDLTPYASWFNDGLPHHLAIRVFNAQSYFSTTANLLLYLDHGADHVTGAVTMNTLDAPAPDESDHLTVGDNGSIAGTVTVTSARDYEISGYVDTSDGRITTDLTQHIAFSSAQIFDIFGSATFHQRLQLGTQVDTTTSVNTGVYSHVVTEHTDWPLSVDYAFDVSTDGSAAQVTTIEQGLQRSIDVGVDGYTPRQASLVQDLNTADTLLFDSDGNLTGHVDQASQQSYSYVDPFGACYSRNITATLGLLSSVDDGADCPDGVNTLPWFDSFYNAGSSIFGATVQILP